ncbi:hypothetical protein FF38_12236 [Lucilia cuprina]|uniref:Uncharacterized protein n=1 Tax=Lucilia cuprina TaxID=7375 RepID=A0A0L0C1J4_LUCCU|nr:hypothetical protein FF38_12236 [Lucilia cuprina]
MFLVFGATSAVCSFVGDIILADFISTDSSVEFNLSLAFECSFNVFSTLSDCTIDSSDKEVSCSILDCSFPTFSVITNECSTTEMSSVIDSELLEQVFFSTVSVSMTECSPAELSSVFDSEIGNKASLFAEVLSLDWSLFCSCISAGSSVELFSVFASEFGDNVSLFAEDMSSIVGTTHVSKPWDIRLISVEFEITSKEYGYSAVDSIVQHSTFSKLSSSCNICSFETISLLFLCVLDSNSYSVHSDTVSVFNKSELVSSVSEDCSLENVTVFSVCVSEVTSLEIFSSIALELSCDTLSLIFAFKLDFAEHTIDSDTASIFEDSELMFIDISAFSTTMGSVHSSTSSLFVESELFSNAISDGVSSKDITFGLISVSWHCSVKIISLSGFPFSFDTFSSELDLMIFSASSLFVESKSFSVLEEIDSFNAFSSEKGTSSFDWILISSGLDSKLISVTSDASSLFLESKLFSSEISIVIFAQASENRSSEMISSEFSFNEDLIFGKSELLLSGISDDCSSEDNAIGVVCVWWFCSSKIILLNAFTSVTSLTIQSKLLSSGILVIVCDSEITFVDCSSEDKALGSDCRLWSLKIVSSNAFTFLFDASSETISSWNFELLFDGVKLGKSEVLLSNNDSSGDFTVGSVCVLWLCSLEIISFSDFTFSFKMTSSVLDCKLDSFCVHLNVHQQFQIVGWLFLQSVLRRTAV